MLYTRWTHAKPEAGFTDGNRNTIYRMVELRPDRGGLIGVDISYLGRDEDGCVFIDERVRQQENRRQAKIDDRSCRGGIALVFTHGPGDGSSGLADGTGP